MAAWRPSRRGPLAPWRRNLYVLMLTVFVSFSGFTFVMPFLPLFIKQLGVTNTGDAALWSGLIFGVSPLISGLLAPFWSSLAERFGAKRIVLFSLLAYACTLSSNALVMNVQQLFLVRLMLGILGSVGVMSTALASTLAPPEESGEAIGLMQATALASGVFAPVFGGVIVDVVGLRPSFVLAGVCSLVACVAMAAGYRDDARLIGAHRRERPSARTYFRLPIFVSLLLTVFVARFIEGSFGPQLPLYIATLGAPTERLGLVTGLVMTLGAAATSIAAAVAGRLSTRVTPVTLLLVALAAGTLCCLPLAFVSHWVQLLVLRVILGLFAGGALILAFAIGGQALPAEVKLGAIAALAGFAQIGMAVSPFVSGVLAKWSSLSTIFIVDAVLYLLLFLWVWWRLAPRSRTRTTAAVNLRADPAQRGDD
ncbi:MAG TPA: MFS transporter [Thermomicrobiales bacterium]|jgi:DHA1 family multidrug resistance protein-like MFS transporter